ncbi:hypothetical protein AZE42_08627 [Rhizopogon vesiculosus]|uniref:F-box domain-containing protein n=1 Tax=Rhizopogon vesiculosus TaxID=180088 RepID=A0A1J8R695_9AGAM|nr:hypothetical protein AZE42_08627 [Rhizopogon vesiculosus]
MTIGIPLIKSALLASLGARCPSIQKLNFAYGTDVEGSLDAMSEAICGWRNLVYLQTGVLDTRVLAHLASLSSLKSLHFTSYDSVDDTPPDSILTFISELDELSITAPSYSLLTRCLRNVHFLGCRSAVLSMDDSDSQLPYVPDIPDLFVSLSECFPPALERLSIDVQVDPDDLRYHHFSIDFDVIAPLLSFSCFRKLDLDWLCTTDIDDDALKSMAQSWPQLEIFRFGAATALLESPSATFIGFIHLIRYCRHLREIMMSFRACPIDINSEPFSKTIPNEKITYIEVGDSPIVGSIAVACQIHSLLPSLSHVNHGYWVWIWAFKPPSIVALGDEWDRVNQYLRMLTKGAEIREKMGELSQECSLTA